jgi:hypothetical protein
VIRRRATVPLLVGGLTTMVVAVAMWRSPEPWTFTMDTGGVFLAQTVLAFRAWFAGHVPEWTDMLWAGFPLAGDSTSAVFYPLYVIPYLTTLANPMRFFDVAFALHLGIFAAGTAAFVRRLGASPSAAAFAGVFAAMTPVAHSAAIAFAAMFAAHAWWPWAFLAAEALAQPATPILGGAMVLGWVALALQVLAGVPEQATYCAVPVTLWILFRSSPLGMGQRLARVVVLGLGATALAAPQLLPTAMILPWTQRSGVPPKYQFGSLLLFHPEHLVVAGTGVLNGMPSFLGLVGPLLAVVALVTRRAGAYLLAGIAVVAFLLALGPQVGLYELVHRVPPFAYFRNPAKIYVLTEYAMVWLAALGLDALWRHPSGRARGVAALLLGALCIERTIYLGQETAAFATLRESDGLTPARYERLAALTRLRQPDPALPPPVLYDDVGPLGGEYARSVGALLGISSLHAGGVALLGANHYRLLSQPSATALDVFGVRYVLTTADRCPAVTTRLRWPVVELGADDCVMENPKAVTRFVLLPSFEPVGSESEMVDLAARRPRPVAVVGPPDIARPTGRGAMSITSYRTGEALLLLATPGPQLILVRESFAPGWTVEVDGRPIDPYPAAGIFFAVPVSTGVHRIYVTYHAPGLRPGLAIAATWVVLATAALAWRRRAQAATS